MEVIRFVSEQEFDALLKNKRVDVINTGRAWSGKKRLYAFPSAYYDTIYYYNIAEYLSNELGIDYDYVIRLDLSDRYKHETFAAYDKQAVDDLLGQEQPFDIDEDAYDSGPVYVVPEVRFVEYTIDDLLGYKEL